MKRLAICTSGLLLALAGCATVDTSERVPVAIDFKPTSACSAQAKVPQIVATSPAVFTDAAWDRKERWASRMIFRLDEEGAPHVIRASVETFDPDHDERVKAVTDVLERYRFCRPVEFSTQFEWSATMRFTSSPVADIAGGGQMVIQLFVPAYSREDVAVGRKGTNKVAGTFGPDGRPTTVRLTASSGDSVLDHKSLAAMATYQLVFRPGTVLKRPLTFEQPYTYEIH